MNRAVVDTIGRPAPHDPMGSAGARSDHQNEVAADDARHTLNGNKKMEIMSEIRARSHMAERLREAESQRTGRRLAAADRLARRSRRLHRRAERASHRARRAIAVAVMQK